jgi:hypothetical protein
MPPTIDERLRELAEATHEQLCPSADLLGRIRASASRGGQIRTRPVRLLGLVAAAAAIVIIAVAVTRPASHGQPNTVPPTTTPIPLSAPRVAQMLAAGQFATIASEIEPPSLRSADQVILEQDWANLTNANGALLSTGTQDEHWFAPPLPSGSPGTVVDETVLQMSHGLILLRVTLSPDGGLVHVELQPGPAFFADVGQSFGF